MAETGKESQPNISVLIHKPILREKVQQNRRIVFILFTPQYY